MRVDGYAPIRDYAAIGDGRTVALVARDGSIDWLCFPDFDSPSAFGALVDAEHGGCFQLEPEEPYEVERRYIPETNVLETTFTTSGGSTRITDAMTVQEGGLVPWRELARRIEGLSGSVPLRWRVEPRFGFGHDVPTVQRRNDAYVATAGKSAVAVQAWDAGHPEHAAAAVAGRFTTERGSRALLALTGAHEAPVELPLRDGVERRLDGTAETWRRWLRQHDYDGPWADAVRRSLLALKLLVDARSGAIMAAPTTSLPERIGGQKNWDYRFAWVRDSAFTLDAFMRLGYREQAHDSLTWLLDAVARTHPRVQPVYTMSGDVLGGEEKLDLPGYRGSKPVRTGNRAAGQLQLGGFGDLLETTWLYVREGNILDEANALSLADVVDLLCELWEHEDAGIWEIEAAHYTQAKMACWEAFDRALRLVDAGQLPSDRAGRWRAEAERVREYVERECWSEEKRSYVQAVGSEKLDASCLLTARLGFADPQGDRLRHTIEAVRSELGDGPLLYRYTGMEQEEGAFLACSFWLVEALARSERFDEAAETMEDLLALANDVDLYSEEIDPATKEFLGNFPQGLTHLSLINAAALFRQSYERVASR